MKSHETETFARPDISGLTGAETRKVLVPRVLAPRLSISDLSHSRTKSLEKPLCTIEVPGCSKYSMVTSKSALKLSMAELATVLVNLGPSPPGVP